MEPRLRSRAHIAVLPAGVGAALFVLTLVFPKWIEAVTRLEPDAGSGALEWIIAGSLLVAAVVSAALAHRDYRHLAASHSDA
jgi:hypothetical protein